MHEDPRSPSTVASLTQAMRVQQPPPPRYRSIDDTDTVRIVQQQFAPYPYNVNEYPTLPQHQGEYSTFLPSTNLPPRTVVPVQNPGLPLDEDSEMNNFRFMPCCDDDNVWRTFTALGLGQLMSLCLCGTAIGSQILSNNGYNAPAAQSFLNYFLLAFVYGLILVCRNGEHNLLNVLRIRGWKYLLLALVDVEANYIIVYAYQFTNLTSIQLLDCSTIPIVMILSFLFLSVRYQLSHIIGVAICMVGLSCVIYADARSGSDERGSNPLIGDLLCVLSTFFYAISNVSQEFLIKEFDRYEYLGFIGLFGSLISGIQFAIFETKNITAVDFSWTILGAYLLFTVSMFAFYSMVSIVVEKTSALMFNLAALTADFYSLIAGIVIFHYTFKPLYLVSFVIVIVGSVVYSLRKTPQGRSDETTIACRCMRAICPCFDCCRECRPTSPYTIQEVTGHRRSPSASIDHHDTSSSSD